MELGNEKTKAGNFNMARKSDRAMVAQAARAEVLEPGRYPGIRKLRNKLIDAAEEALQLALDDKNSRDITRCIDTIAGLDRIEQADEHLDKRFKMAADGKPETVSEIRVVRVKESKLERLEDGTEQDSDTDRSGGNPAGSGEDIESEQDRGPGA